jgi:phosphomevalonate kinase
MKGLIDDDLLKGFAQAMDMAPAVEKKKEPQDYQQQKLWREVQYELQMLVWAVVNDGVIEGSEIRLLMNMLKSHGVPDTPKTYQMLKGFLEKEASGYATEYDNLSDAEREHKLQEEMEIKEALRDKLKQQARDDRQAWSEAKAKENARECRAEKSFLKQILSEEKGEKQEQKLTNTLESMLGFMGFEMPEKQDMGSFVARFNEEKYNNQAQLG